jgi:hypothetical protein
MAYSWCCREILDFRIHHQSISNSTLRVGLYQQTSLPQRRMSPKRILLQNNYRSQLDQIGPFGTESGLSVP